MIARLLQLAFWAALTFAFVMACLPHPPQPLGHPSDKLQHIAAFATLAALGAGAWPRLPLVTLGLRLCALGAAIEIVQLLPAVHRDSDVWDWVADSAAILVVLAAVGVRRFFRDADPGSP